MVTAPAGLVGWLLFAFLWLCAGFLFTLGAKIAGKIL